MLLPPFLASADDLIFTFLSNLIGPSVTHLQLRRQTWQKNDFDSAIACELSQMMPCGRAVIIRQLSASEKGRGRKVQLTSFCFLQVEHNPGKLPSTHSNWSDYFSSAVPWR